MTLDKAIKTIAVIFVCGFGISFFITWLGVFLQVHATWIEPFFCFGLLFSFSGCALHFYFELLSPYNTNGNDGSE